jgi:hypothetical protein
LRSVISRSTALRSGPPLKRLRRSRNRHDDFATGPTPGEVLGFTAQGGR